MMFKVYFVTVSGMQMSVAILAVGLVVTFYTTLVSTLTIYLPIQFTQLSIDPLNIYIKISLSYGCLSRNMEKALV